MIASQKTQGTSWTDHSVMLMAARFHFLQCPHHRYGHCLIMSKILPRWDGEGRGLDANAFLLSLTICRKPWGPHLCMHACRHVVAAQALLPIADTQSLRQKRYPWEIICHARDLCCLHATGTTTNFHAASKQTRNGIMHVEPCMM